VNVSFHICTYCIYITIYYLLYIRNYSIFILEYAKCRFDTDLRYWRANTFSQQNLIESESKPWRHMSSCSAMYLFLGSITTLTIMNFNHRQIKRDKTTLFGLFDIFIINLERSGSVAEVLASWQHCSTPVVRIRDVYPGSESYPNPGSSAKKHSLILDPDLRI
jgi:hypothetical protein